jgi:hypothetical protein
VTALPAIALISDWHGHGVRRVEGVLAELACHDPEAVADFTAALLAAVAWNERHPVGTPVRFARWPGRQLCDSVTTTAAYATVQGIALVQVRGQDGGVELGQAFTEA